MDTYKPIHKGKAGGHFPAEDLTANSYYEIERLRRVLQRSSSSDLDVQRLVRLSNIIKDGLHLEYSHPRFGLVKHKSLTDFLTSKHGLNANPMYLFRAVEGNAAHFPEAQDLLELFKTHGFWYPAANINVELGCNHRPSEVTADQAKQIKQLDQQGMTQREIASGVKKSPATVNRVLFHNCTHGNTYETKPKSDLVKRPGNRGNCNDYHYARLKRDNPELAAAVETGEKSIYQASVESGARRKLLLNLHVTEATSMAKVSKKIYNSLPPDKLAELASLLTELASNKQQTTNSRYY